MATVLIIESLEKDFLIRLKAVSIKNGHWEDKKSLCYTEEEKTVFKKCAKK